MGEFYNYSRFSINLFLFLGFAYVFKLPTHAKAFTFHVCVCFFQFFTKIPFAYGLNYTFCHIQIKVQFLNLDLAIHFMTIFGDIKRNPFPLQSSLLVSNYDINHIANISNYKKCPFTTAYSEAGS